MKEKGAIFCLLSIMALAVWSSDAEAYQRYKNAGAAGTWCAQCHGNFSDGTSPKGTAFPGNNKHQMHRDAGSMATACALCHSASDNFNPLIGSSDGTTSNVGIGCTGCHEGKGLRAHHARAGVSSCIGCHGSATPLPENTKPPYYGTADTRANEPCNGTAQSNINENWSIGDFTGLDNDGDGIYDGADADCGGGGVAYPNPYYFPIVKDNDSIGWANWLTVQAKDPVAMDVRIKVYNMNGTLVGQYIYSGTDPSANAPSIAPYARVAQRPSMIVGTLANPIPVEGSMVIETSVPAIATTNTISNFFEGFSIVEAARPRALHNFPKAFDGPNNYQVYMLVQNILPTQTSVTATLYAKTASEPGNGATRTYSIPANGTLKFRPSDVAGGINFNGSVVVSSDGANPGDGLGPDIPAMCRYELGTEAMTIYESTMSQPALFFPIIKDGKFGGAMDYQNYLSVVNTDSRDATVEVILHANDGTWKASTGPVIIPANGKATWRPSMILGTVTSPVDFEGSVQVTSSIPVVGQTNTMYPGMNSYQTDAFDLFESAIPNTTLFFPKAFDNLAGEGRLYDNFVHVQNPDATARSIAIEQFNNNGTANGSRTVPLGPNATYSFRPKDLVTDGTGTFRGSIRVSEAGGLKIAGAIKYELHQGMTTATPIDAMTLYRSMGQEETPVDPITEAWSRSGHADATSPAFHYWDATGSIPTTCAKCHSPDGYNDFTKDGTVNAAVPTGKVLGCSTCHTDTFATLWSDSANNPALEPVTFPSGKTATLRGPSNMCMACHQGRSSTVNVDATIAAKPAGPFSFVNIHYFPVAATLFGTEVQGGYEYTGMTYRGRNNFPAHPDALKTCVGCHMRGDRKDHSLRIQLADCNGCHGGASFETLGGSPGVNQADITALATQLLEEIQNYASSVIGTPIGYHAAAYPYFFKDTNANGVIDPDEAVSTNGYNLFDAKLLKAAYNYQVALKEPCGYIHNGTYIKQLLYDSIVDLGAMPIVTVTVAGRTSLATLAAPARQTAQWQVSGHADTASPAFHNWDAAGVVSTSCARCHGTPGFIDYAKDGVVSVAPPVGSMIDCTACHDNVNTFTTLWSDNATYPMIEPVAFPSGYTATLGNASNICMACHQGRSWKGVVDARVLPTSFVNIHYFPAAAVFFGTEVKGGYEYDGKTYRGRNTFASHPEEFRTCIGCHLRGAEKNHEMLPDVAKCAACHGGTSLETLGGSPDVNHTDLVALADALYIEIKDYALATAGGAIAYNAATYPYFYKDTNGNGIVDATETTAYSFTDRKLLNAAYNYQVYKKEPGGFIHNGIYLRELLHDSIMDLNPDAIAPAARASSADASCTLCHGNRAADAPPAHDMTSFLAKYTVSDIATAFVDHDNNSATNPRFRVTFTVMDGATPVTTLASRTGLVRANLSKLLPGVNGSPSTWANYIGTTTTTGRPSTVNSTATNLVHQGGGVYAMTFDATGQDVMAHPLGGKYAWNASATHRVGIQISGTFLDGTPVKATNAWLDFVPNGGAPALTRDITTTASCNSCHEKINIHGGGRYATEYCVTCHTDDRANGRAEATNHDADGNFVIVPPATSTGTYVVDGFAQGDFPVMIHKIHMGHNLSRQGYDYAGALFNHVTYPQEQANCRKCHRSDGPGGTRDGDNWMYVPSRKACGACHDAIRFTATYTFGIPHTGGPQADDSGCAGCHAAADIEQNHLTVNSTVNNPNVPAGAANFTYEIKSATVNAGRQAVIMFRILRDGTPVTFGASGTTLLAGFTGSPSFLVAYALPQNGISAPADFNNLGRAAAQPASVSITNLWNGTQGILSTPDQDGYYTATLTAAATTFPADSTMRTVALQGYFTQVSPAIARHALSVVAAVDGDTERRAIIDPVKCASCHEVFEAHGGNRNIGFTTTGTVVCILCHNPNLSSSGRGADLAQSSTNLNTLATIAKYGDNPLTYPEDTNNFKDMIHGIHASAVRLVRYEFVRDRGTSGVFSYDFSEVTFPANVKSCTLCHIPGTFDVAGIPETALETTKVTTDGVNATTAAVRAARATVPNSTDLVVDPLNGVCISCHALPGVENGHGARTRSSTAPINPHDGGFSITSGCANCHIGSDVVADIHGNTCTLCHGGKPSRFNEIGLAVNADGTAAAGTWSSVSCITCHTAYSAPGFTHYQ